MHLLKWTVAVAVACVLPLSIAGCRKRPPAAERPPTERMLVVKPPAAPGLTESKPGQKSKRTAHQGDVFKDLGKAASFHWEGELEGQRATRDGDLLQVARSESDGTIFVFASDLEPADVPAASWICERLGNPVLMQIPCVQGLKRTMLPGGRALAFASGIEPACPVALVRGSELGLVEVIGLGDVRVMTMNGREAVLGWSRWVRGENWTGQTLVVMLTEPSLRKIGEVALEEADARKPDEVTNRMGALSLSADGIRFEGKGRVVERATGKEKSVVDFVESWRVTREGTLQQTRN